MSMLLYRKCHQSKLSMTELPKLEDILKRLRVVNGFVYQKLFGNVVQNAKHVFTN